MASAWGTSWGTSWLNSWGAAVSVTVTRGFKGKKKHRYEQPEEEKPIIRRRSEQRYGPDNDYGLDSLDIPQPVTEAPKKKAKKKPETLTSFAELAERQVNPAEYAEAALALQGIMDAAELAKLSTAEMQQLIQMQEDELIMLMMLAA